jgi:hypothetical protein
MQLVSNPFVPATAYRRWALESSSVKKVFGSFAIFK